MMIIRGAQTPTAVSRPYDRAFVAGPLGEQVAALFAAELAADRVPSVRAIRAELHVAQPRAQRLREYLAATAQTHGRSRAA